METTDSQSNNQGILKIVIGVLVGVLALLGYLFMGARNESLELQKSLTSKVEQLSSTQIKLDSISKSLDQKIAEVQSLGGNVAELEAVKAQLENDKKKLKSDFSLQNAIQERFQTIKSMKGDTILRQRKFELLTYLPDLLMRQDKMSMAHSIENRVPFLDNDMVTTSLNISGLLQK